MKVKEPKKKAWSLLRADSVFSLSIRERDGKCQFPSCEVTDIKSLQCSHYVGRANKAVRFDPDNCVALCWLHHFKDKQLGYEYQKQMKHKHGWDGQYTLFMKKRLGKEGFSNLMARATLRVKQEKAILDFMESYGA